MDNYNIEILKCKNCGSERGHGTAHEYRSHSDGERYAKSLYRFCMVCNTMNYVDRYDLIFIVVAYNKANYFKEELKAKAFAKQHNTVVVEDVLRD